MPMDVEGMVLKCRTGQTSAWDVDGMVGPGCSSWLEAKGKHNWAEELGCCRALARVNSVCGCLRDGTSWMLNDLMDVSEKMLCRFNLKHKQGGKHGADGGMAEGC